MNRLFILILFFFTTQAGAQNMAINNDGSSAHTKAILDLKSTDKGLLVPRMTEVQRNTMFLSTDATAKGMLVYQTDGVEGYYYYNGIEWKIIETGNKGWGLNGNNGTNTSTDFIGTTDNKELRVKTNNTAAILVTADQKVTIGSDVPYSRLYVRGSDSAMASVTIKNLHNNGYSGVWMVNNNGYISGHVGFGNTASPKWSNQFYVGSITNSPAIFTTNDIERMRINESGAIGIGTSNPQSWMQIQKNSAVGYPQLLMTETDSADYARLSFGNNYATKFWSIAARADNNNDEATLNIFNSSSGNLVTVKGNGNVGIGNGLPSFPLSFSNSLGDKIALWTGGSYNYGFGIQSNLLQIHSGTVADDIAFGYGSSTSFSEVMRVKGNGFVGIGTNNPSSRLQITGNEMSVPLRIGNQLNTGYAGMHFMNAAGSTIMGHAGYGNPGASSLADQVYFGSVASVPVVLTSANTERMRITEAGNVGIGTNAPTAKLEVQSNSYTGGQNIKITEADNDFARVGYYNTASTKFWETTAYSDASSDAVSSYNVYNSSTGNLLTVKGDGKVGIGTSNPGTTLEVNGYTKLGSNAPAIKMKKLTSTTASSQGSSVNIAHGLDASKIISIDVMVEWATNSYIHTDYNWSNGYNFSWYSNGTNIVVNTTSGNSASILNKPIKILVTYEE